MEREPEKWTGPMGAVFSHQAGAAHGELLTHVVSRLSNLKVSHSVPPQFQDRNSDLSPVLSIKAMLTDIR